ncbi:MAG: hypothetical protein K2N94_03880 [Lachnospiraceae bacterium]|nr:hypothetical protein [Lachnospiraceae bacterium]
MKKIFCAFFVILLLGGCGDKKSSPLPDDLEKVLIEYLNYEAWCNPNDFSQEKTTYSYHAYRKSEEEQKFPEIFLKIEMNEGVVWYCCTYTRQKIYCIEPLREVPKELEETDSGELILPEVTRPVFADSTIKNNALEEIQKGLDSYCGRAFEEAYHAGECIEVYLTDFCMENGIMPTMYLICGDKVCELYSYLSHQADWMAADMSIVFWADTNEDGSFMSLVKEDIDKEKFERICQIAILHAEYKKEEGIKLILGHL